MNVILHAMAGMFMLGLIFLVSFLIMIYGWGLEVQSWPWIIGGYIASCVLTIINSAIMSSQ